MSDKNIPPSALPARPDAAVRFKEIAPGVHAVATADVNGQAGVMVTTNNTAVTGNFTSIQILEDTVFSVFTETGTLPGSQPMTGFTLYAGQTLFGCITAYTLTSGKVRAHA